MVTINRFAALIVSLIIEAHISWCVCRYLWLFHTAHLFWVNTFAFTEGCFPNEFVCEKIVFEKSFSLTWAQWFLFVKHIHHSLTAQRQLQHPIHFFCDPWNRQKISLASEFPHLPIIYSQPLTSICDCFALSEFSITLLCSKATWNFWCEAWICLVVCVCDGQTLGSGPCFGFCI